MECTPRKTLGAKLQRAGWENRTNPDAPTASNTIEHEALAMQQVVRRKEALRDAADSIGLLAQIAFEEAVIISENLRRRGRQLRQYCRANIFDSNFGFFLRRMARIFMRRASKKKPARLEGIAALGSDPLEDELAAEVDVPRSSLNDLARILLTDDVEDGVMRRFQLWGKPWDSLPEREVTTMFHDDFGSASDFQFFNRPLSGLDDDDRFSTPSTAPNDATMVMAIEAQMMMLRNQLAYFTQQNGMRMPPPMMPTKYDLSPSTESNHSLDEGICTQSMKSYNSRLEHYSKERGSSRNSHRHETASGSALPVVRPPPGPPPPPPPPPPAPINLAPVPKTPMRKAQEAASLESMPSPVSRPSAMDLQAVKLRKTEVAKSPGGTPLNKAPLRGASELLVTALRSRCNVMMSDIEDEDTDGLNDSTQDEWEDKITPIAAGCDSSSE